VGAGACWFAGENGFLRTCLPGPADTIGWEGLSVMSVLILLSGAFIGTFLQKCFTKIFPPLDKPVNLIYIAIMLKRSF
jgi:hypothetical protein